MSILKKIYSRNKLQDGRIKQRILGICFKYYPRLQTYLPVKKPRLGVSYSVWDGEELLEGAIRSIRAAVDYVNVVWQKYSWHGNECNPNLEKNLLQMQKMGLIDEIIFFDCDPTINPIINECAKRNLGLKAAKRNGCTHFMTLDTDEYFDIQQFKTAYKYILDHNISHSACVQFGYRTPTIRFSDPMDFFPPFIYRIDHNEHFSVNAYQGALPWLIDPTKQIAITKRSRICFLHNVFMHHYSFVRKNYDKKLYNSSANQNVSWVNDYKEKTGTNRDDDTQSKIKKGIFVQVPNLFNININDNEQTLPPPTNSRVSED